MQTNVGKQVDRAMGDNQRHRTAPNCKKDRECNKQESNAEHSDPAVVNVVGSLNDNAGDGRKPNGAGEFADLRHEISPDYQFFKEAVDQHKRQSHPRHWPEDLS